MLDGIYIGDCVFSMIEDGDAHANSTTETSLFTGLGTGQNQPRIPANFLSGAASVSRRIRFEASGVFSNTGTPTLIFALYANTTAGVANLAGTKLGLSAAITGQSGVTNKQWSLEWDGEVRIAGIGSGAMTISGSGWVWSPGGFASPFMYALQPTTPDTATWTTTFDASVAHYINLSADWSAADVSNTITCKKAAMYVY